LEFKKWKGNNLERTGVVGMFKILELHRVSYRCISTGAAICSKTDLPRQSDEGQMRCHFGWENMLV